MTKFEWRTGEEGGWVDKPRYSGRPPASQGRRWWVALLLLSLLGLAGTAVLYRQTMKRVEVATAQTEAEILNTHNLLMSAAENRDLDLFQTLLSGRDLEWVEQQFERVRRGAFVQRVLFDQIKSVSHGSISPTHTQALEIIIADDFLAAELTYPVSVVFNVGEGVEETVTLRQTAQYRLGRNGWLYAPLDDAFWGQWEAVTFDRIHLIVSERDEPFAEKLGEQLNRLLEQLCQQPAYACAPDWRLLVRLERSEEIWDAVENDAYLLTPHIPFSLPTPTLLGLPTDQESEAAVQQLYQTAILTHAVVHLTGYQCCAQRSLFRLLVDLQLHEMAIRPFSQDEALYIKAFNNWDETTLNRMWGRFRHDSDQDRAQLATLVGFLHSQNSTLSVSHMLVALAGGNETIEQWLAALMGGSNVEKDLLLGWEAHVFEQSGLGNLTTSFYPLPNDRLRLVCAQHNILTLNEYHFDTDSWETIYTLAGDSFNSFYFMQNLANSAWYSITEHSTTEGGTKTELSIMREGERVLLLTLGDGEGYAYVYDINVEQSVALVILNSPEEMQQTAILYDLTNCTAQGCGELNRFKTYFGLRWSPNGRYATSSQPQDSVTFTLDDPSYDATLNLADELGRPLHPIDSSASRPIWIDDRHVGYIKMTPTTASERVDTYDDFTLTFMVYDLAEDRAYPLITPEVIRLALQKDNLPALMPNYAHFASSDGRLLYLNARPIDLTQSSEQYLIRVELDLPNLVSLTHIKKEPELYRYAMVANDWQTLVEPPQSGDPVGVLLEHVETGEQYELKLFHNGLISFWSSDKNWIISNRTVNELMLLEPDSGYRRFIPHDFEGCQYPHWAAVEP